MSSDHSSKQKPTRLRARTVAAALIAFVSPTVLALAPLVGASTRRRSPAPAAAVCSMSAVSTRRRRQDHGGRVFFEFWDGYQYQNYIGSSRAPSSLNTDKVINTQWYNVGFEYMFNRDLGCHGSHTDRQSHADHRNRPVLPGANSIVQQPRYRRYRDHGHIHRIFPGHVHRSDLGRQAAERHL